LRGEQLERLLRPVGREHLPTARGRDEARDAEAAAELDDAPAAQARRQRLGERQPGRPELRPVRQELLLREDVLVDQRLRVRRAEQRELQPAGDHGVVYELDAGWMFWFTWNTLSGS
jgi:hypothetical protein